MGELVGKLTPSAPYVHEPALERLPVPLRLFEGCGRGYLGRVEGAKGLYADARRIGTRDGWAAVLAAKGLQHLGHRLVRSR